VNELDEPLGVVMDQLEKAMMKLYANYMEEEVRFQKRRYRLTCKFIELTKDPI